MRLEEAKKLSPEEINRTIAEAIGWTVGAKGWWSAPGHAGTGDDPDPPDYFHDLNACHSAFNQLKEWEKTRLVAWVHFYHSNGELDYGLWRLFYALESNVRAIALACVLSERKK